MNFGLRGKRALVTAVNLGMNAAIATNSDKKGAVAVTTACNDNDLQNAHSLTGCFCPQISALHLQAAKTLTIQQTTAGLYPAMLKKEKPPKKSSMLRFGAAPIDPKLQHYDISGLKNGTIKNYR